MADFTKHIVNRKFKEVYYALLDRGIVRGKSDIAKNLGTYNHIINNILKGERNITVDMILLLSDYYNINSNFLFGLDEHMMFSPSLLENDFFEMPSPSGNVVMVPAQAFGAYVLGISSEQAVEEYEYMNIPNIDGEHYAFEAVGDSMQPTVMQGDLVVTKALETKQEIRNNRMYVLVSDAVVIKRIQKIKTGNRITELKLISDNSTLYKPYRISIKEVRQILEVKYRITNSGIK